MLTDFLHVAVLCSKRAPGLDALLRHPLRGIVYDVDCVVTSELDLRDCGAPVVAHPIRSFYDERRAPISDQRMPAWRRRAWTARPPRRPRPRS